MGKKSVSIITLLAFTLFELTCTQVVKRPIKQVAGPRNEGLVVRRVLLKSGKVIEFPEKKPARIQGIEVCGIIKKTYHQVAIPSTDVESVKERLANIQEIKTKSGKVYNITDGRVSSIQKENNTYIVTFKAFPAGADTVSVLKSEVESVKSTSDQAGGKSVISSLKTRSGLEYRRDSDPNIISIEEENDQYLIYFKLSSRDIKSVSVPMSEVKSVKSKGFYQKKTKIITSIVLLPGTEYSLDLDVSITSIQKKEDRYVIYYDPAFVHIPFYEIDLVWVERTDVVSTFFAVVGGVALGLVAVAAIIAATKESCPFIYSFDGDRFVFDAEPYGGATSRGLQRTEWCTLEHLREVAGLYRLRITNEVEETQNTDELKLLIVDHPQGVQAVPDETGGVHTIARPVPPSLARDGRGRDILSLTGTDDWMFWQSRLEDKDPDNPADTRDELLFEFPKPAGATQAKLLFNGCNTLWASQMVKRLLELHGEEVAKCYAAVDAKGFVYQALMNWNLQEELYRLSLRVETETGWRSKGTVVGGGPFMSEDRVYPLDLSDVPGDTVRIKLLPPAGFWMINCLALDYAPDMPILTTEIAPVEATDSAGRDIRPLLLETDQNYYSMPLTGDWGSVSFLAPPSQPGLARTVICKASGYYDIHLSAKGKPRTDILDRLQREPGFAARYALKEYFRWVRENSKTARNEQ